MGADLSEEPAAGGAIRVALTSGEPVSGLADMLHQYIEQTLAGSPRKVERARRLSGEAVFRSAEDEDLFVRVIFAGDRIELHDGGTLAPADTLITADFLSLAHLTAGQEGPLHLLARRKLRIRFSLLQLPFLLRMLRFMQIDTAAGLHRRRAVRARWIWAVALVAACGGLYWYVAAHF